MAHRRKLRLGMVGGGRGSMIGDSHRIAARLDGRFELAAGAFDIDPARGRAFAEELGIAPERAYGDWRQMVEQESRRDDRVDLVTVATPNNTHFEISRAFLEAGFHVLCEKPLAISVAEAETLAGMAREKDLICAVMYGYSGYALVRQMRAMVRRGEIGRVRVVQAEFAHGGHGTAVERNQPAAAWRYDPAVAGPSSVLADAGSHALHLACYTACQDVSAVSAMFTTCVEGRKLEDNAQLQLRFDGGAVGALWASSVAVGNAHGLAIRLYGETGGLAWCQEQPNQLRYAPLGRPTRIIERGSPDLHPEAARASRVSAGHAEGYFVGFANVYRDLADVIAARIEGREPDPLACDFPDVEAGLQGVRQIAAAVASASRAGAWVSEGLQHDRPERTVN